MSHLFTVLLIIGLVLLITKTRRVKSPVTNKKKPAATAKAKRKENLAKLAFHQNFLSARWAEADALRESGKQDVFGDWYYKTPTKMQLKKLESLGLSGVSPLTRGAASDVIGLYSACTDRERKILQFFKEPATGLSETEARERARVLMQDPDNLALWEQRPPSAEQKLFFSYFKIPLPRKTTHAEADKLIGELTSEKDGAPAEVDCERWDAVISTWSDISCPEMREEYEIKKPSAKAFLEILAEIEAEGQDMEELTIAEVAEHIHETRPSLSRED